MDEIVCPMQGTSTEAAFVGLDPLSVRMGVAGCWRGSRKTYNVSRANKKVCLKVTASLAFWKAREGSLTS